MAEGFQEFLRTIGPEFNAKAQMILDAMGAVDLEEIIENVDCREDLRDLDREEVGMKALHVKKLFKAIMRAKEECLAEAEAEAGLPPAQPMPQTFPKLEKLMSTVPEDTIKEPSRYVACTDASVHDELPVGKVAEEEKAMSYVPPRGESAALLEALQPHQRQAPTAPPTATPVKKVPLPDPMRRTPLVIQKKEKAATGPAVAVAAPVVYKKNSAEFPDLGPAGSVPEVTRQAQELGLGQAAAQRHALEVQRAREEGEGDQATLSNAELASRMLQDRKATYNLRRDAYDRTVEVFWNTTTRVGAPSPISALSEAEFQAEFKAALHEFCQGVPEEEGPMKAQVEEWLLFEPASTTTKKGREMRPHALVLFNGLEQVQMLFKLYVDRLEADDSFKRFYPIIKIKGQPLMIQHPNPDFVCRADSSKASDTASQVGSENSHSAWEPSKYRNLTLLFMNLPEAVHASLAQRPAAKDTIEGYVQRVLEEEPQVPIAKETFKYNVSFTEPRKAPYGGCWLSFKYTVERKRIHGGRAHSLEEFKKLHAENKQAEERKTADVVKSWERGQDAAHTLEKQLAGGGKLEPISIAKWFVQRVKEKQVPPPHGGDKDKIWTECEVGGKRLSLEFSRFPRGG